MQSTSPRKLHSRPSSIASVSLVHHPSLPLQYSSSRPGSPSKSRPGSPSKSSLRRESFTSVSSFSVDLPETTYKSPSHELNNGPGTVGGDSKSITACTSTPGTDTVSLSGDRSSFRSTSEHSTPRRGHQHAKSLSTLPGVAQLSTIFTNSGSTQTTTTTTTTTNSPLRKIDTPSSATKRFTIMGSAAPERRDTDVASVKSRPGSLFNFNLFTAKKSGGADGAEESTCGGSPTSTTFTFETAADTMLHTPQKVGKRLSNVRLTEMYQSPLGAPSTKAGYELPPHPDLINEFEGLSFKKIVDSFLVPPEEGSTPEDPAEALKYTAEGRLEALAEEANGLLERMYQAYLKRTRALADNLREMDAMSEELEESRLKGVHLRSQMDAMGERHKREQEDKDKRIQELEACIRDQQEEMLRLRNSNKPADAEKEPGSLRSPSTLAEKRISSSATSDSGFESDKSDTDSLHSTLSRILPPEDVACPTCSRQLAHTSNPKSPTPLREAWSSDATEIVASPTSTRPPSVIQAQQPAQKTGWAFNLLRKNTGGTQDQSTVDALRQENKILRERVAGLESAVEGCLGVIGGWRG